MKYKEKQSKTRNNEGESAYACEPKQEQIGREDTRSKRLLGPRCLMRNPKFKKINKFKNTNLKRQRNKVTILNLK